MALDLSSIDFSGIELTPEDLALIPPEWLPPKFFDTESRSGYIIEVASITYGIAIFTLGLRLWSRLIGKNRLWWDDYLIISCAVLLSGVLSSTVLAAQKGVGRHVGTLDDVDPAQVQAIIFSVELLFLITVTLVKFSILAFYWRIFGVQKSIRIPVFVIAGVTLAWATGAFFATIFQCVPVQKLWRPALEGYCFEVRPFFLGTAIPNFIIDIAILILPAPYVWKLKIKIGDKCMLMGTFLLGGFAAVSAIVRLWAVATMDYASADETWTATESLIWGFVEPAFGIISANLPMLRPLVIGAKELFTGKKSTSESGGQTPSSSKMRGATASSGSTGKFGHGVHVTGGIHIKDEVQVYSITKSGSRGYLERPIVDEEKGELGSDESNQERA